LQRAGVTDADARANAAPDEDFAKPPPRNDRIDLVIDSLQNYEVIKPIPVVIGSLGGKIFTAEAPDLSVSTCENSQGAALLLLKDHITTLYEEYRMKTTLNPDRRDSLRRYRCILEKPSGSDKIH
jgi:hypothetical protein